MYIYNILLYLILSAVILGRKYQLKASNGKGCRSYPHEIKNNLLIAKNNFLIVERLLFDSFEIVDNHKK